jgi:hypothetical protein
MPAHVLAFAIQAALDDDQPRPAQTTGMKHIQVFSHIPMKAIMRDTITLAIEGSVVGKEMIADWEAEVFTLDGAERRQQAALPSLDLIGDTVLELANGIRILVALEDAHRYLGNAVRGGISAPSTVLTVGQALRLEGKHCQIPCPATAWTPGLSKGCAFAARNRLL